MKGTVYCIDTCSVLEQGRKYPPDVFIDLWGRIDGLIDSARMISSEEVYRELVDNPTLDAAVKWAKHRRKMFLDISSEIEAAAIPIIQDYGTRLVDYRREKSSGDPWVIATASHYRCTIVTEEGRSGGVHCVKIPDVCEDLGIPHTNLLGLMRAEGWTFRSGLK